MSHRAGTALSGRSHGARWLQRSRRVPRRLLSALPAVPRGGAWAALVAIASERITQGGTQRSEPRLVMTPLVESFAIDRLSHLL